MGSSAERWRERRAPVPAERFAKRTCSLSHSVQTGQLWGKLYRPAEVIDLARSHSHFLRVSAEIGCDEAVAHQNHNGASQPPCIEGEKVLDAGFEEKFGPFHENGSKRLIGVFGGQAEHIRLTDILSRPCLTRN